MIAVLSGYTGFQSTPPVKAATQEILDEEEEDNISIHAAREGGDAAGRTVPLRLIQFQSTPPVKAATCKHIHRGHEPVISIHAAREGGDAAFKPLDKAAQNFNPRRP